MGGRIIAHHILRVLFTHFKLFGGHLTPFSLTHLGHGNNISVMMLIFVVVYGMKQSQFGLRTKTTRLALGKDLNLG